MVALRVSGLPESVFSQIHRLGPLTVLYCECFLETFFSSEPHEPCGVFISLCGLTRFKRPHLDSHWDTWTHSLFALYLLGFLLKWRQHDMEALSIVEEAEADTTMSRCIWKKCVCDSIFFCLQSFHFSQIKKTFLPHKKQRDGVGPIFFHLRCLFLF